MRAVTGVECTLGRDDGPSIEGLAHPVEWQRFAIDRTEVAHAIFTDYLNALGVVMAGPFEAGAASFGAMRRWTTSSSTSASLGRRKQCSRPRTESPAYRNHLLTAILGLSGGRSSRISCAKKAPRRRGGAEEGVGDGIAAG